MSDLMVKISDAVRDLRYLLNQGYPRDSAVNFVANHYRLPLNQRHLLARCVFSRLEVAEHRQKSHAGLGRSHRRIARLVCG